MTLRLFAGLPIPDEIAERFEPLMKGVKGAKWRRRDQFHITLAFFGELDERRAEALDSELARIDQSPFEIQLKGAGHFGRTEPHALWLGVEDNSALHDLAGRVERRARALGLDMEKRVYRPHVTIAYLRRPDLERLATFERRLGLYKSKPFMADRFYLYSSWFHDKGGTSYEIEAEYPLHHKLVIG
ncbi:RNA 2',3'-cyclic phosphodiesterase [Woodsholea maritima]|uniref:RNA 2',3'-cyclic phosphodiesterase n=1 Tax=Woodsholea maritima TaxID=240237 RepID=UPI00037858E8|nr:RNA 2',3'-cyclic phosphodiesterase [Woodsholea maritima]